MRQVAGRELGRLGAARFGERTWGMDVTGAPPFAAQDGTARFDYRGRAEKAAPPRNAPIRCPIVSAGPNPPAEAPTRPGRAKVQGISAAAPGDSCSEGTMVERHGARPIFARADLATALRLWAQRRPRRRRPAGRWSMSTRLPATAFGIAEDLARGSALVAGTAPPEERATDELAVPAFVHVTRRAAGVPQNITEGAAAFTPLSANRANTARSRALRRMRDPLCRFPLDPDRTARHPPSDTIVREQCSERKGPARAGPGSGRPPRAAGGHASTALPSAPDWTQ